MATAIVILHILVCILIVAMVLLQSGKGAAIGSTFGGGGSQALFGSSGPTSLLTKITALAAIIFMVTSIYLTILSKQAGTGSVMSDTPAVSAPVTEAEPTTSPEPEAEKSTEAAAPADAEATPAPETESTEADAPTATDETEKKSSAE